MAYAKDTYIDARRTQYDIETLLERHGCDGFGYGRQGQQAMIEFALQGRRYRFILPLPDPQAAEFRLTPTTRRPRADSARAEAYEQAVRSRWRALLLVIKAKLEAVDAGISTIEREFFSATVLPNGRTLGEHVAPQIAEMYETGRMAEMLPALGPGSG